MRPAFVACVVLVVVLLAGCGDPAPELTYHKCVAPTLALAPEGGEPVVGETPTVTAGGVVRVVGRHFSSTCVPADGPSVGDPLAEVRLYFEQGDQRVSVANRRADGPDQGFDVPVGIPATLSPGPALLIATTSDEIGAPELATADLIVG